MKIPLNQSPLPRMTFVRNLFRINMSKTCGKSSKWLFSRHDVHNTTSNALHQHHSISCPMPKKFEARPYAPQPSCTPTLQPHDLQDDLQGSKVHDAPAIPDHSSMSSVSISSFASSSGSQRQIQDSIPAPSDPSCIPSVSFSSFAIASRSQKQIDWMLDISKLRTSKRQNLTTHPTIDAFRHANIARPLDHEDMQKARDSPIQSKIHTCALQSLYVNLLFKTYERQEVTRAKHRAYLRSSKPSCKLPSPPPPSLVSHQMRLAPAKRIRTS